MTSTRHGVATGLRWPVVHLRRQEGRQPDGDPAAATLQIDFSRFDPDPDGTIVLVARWTLTATNGVIEDSNHLTAKRNHSEGAVVSGLQRIEGSARMGLPCCRRDPEPAEKFGTQAPDAEQAEI